MAESVAEKPTADVGLSPAEPPNAGEATAEASMAGSGLSEQPIAQGGTSAEPSIQQPLAAPSVGPAILSRAEGAARDQMSEEDREPQWLKEFRESAVGEAMKTITEEGLAEAVSPAEIPASHAENKLVESVPPVEEELPEWLREARQPEEPTTETADNEMKPPALKELAPEELPEWLSKPQMVPSGDRPAAQLEAKQSETVAPESGTGEMPQIPDSQLVAGSTALKTEDTAHATETPDQVPASSSLESQPAQSQQAQSAEAKAMEPTDEGGIEPPGLTRPAELERAPEPAASGDMPDWMRELAPRVGPAQAGTTKPLRTEPPQLAQDEREELPDWLREPFPAKESAAPAVSGADSEVAAPTPLSEMPGWIEELGTPGERVVAGGAPAEVTETEGPLTGLRGVLPIAFGMAHPHRVSAASIPQNDSGRMFESVITATSEGTLAPAATISKPARRSLANRWIFLAVFLAALIPLFIPSDSAGLGLKVNNSTPTARFYDKIHSLARGSTVLLAFDYDTGQTVELNPAARVIVQDLARRSINVVALSTSPAGAQIAQTILEDASIQSPDWRRGANFVNVGYIPGAEAGLRTLADRWLSPNQKDFENESLASLSLAHKVESMRDFSLAIEFAGSDASLRSWMEQVQPRQQVTFVAAVSATVEPQARNYLAANQLAAFLRGLGGAAEYELFSNQTGLTVRTVDAQSFSQILIAAIIVLGNLAFLAGRLRKS
jgi:hypothetical protein